MLLVFERRRHLDDEWSELLFERTHSLAEMIVVSRGILEVKIVSDSFWEFRAEEELIWSIRIPSVHHLR